MMKTKQQTINNCVFAVVLTIAGAAHADTMLGSSRNLMGKILRNQGIHVLSEEVPEPVICGYSDSSSSHIDALNPCCRIRNSLS